MGSVHKYKTKAGTRYLVRYKKPDGVQAAKRGFRTKFAAQDYLATVSVSISANQYVDPTDGEIRIAELADTWLQDQAAVLKPSSMRSLESAWRIHVKPRWGSVPVGQVRYSDVRAWVTEIASKRGATTTIRSYGVLAAILDIAVRDRRIAENAARGIKLPRKQPKRRVYLTHQQVHALALQSMQPTLIYFLAYTGLRWGEATGLRVDDINLARRRVHVQENAVMVNGTIHVGTPKTHAARSVPYPDFLDALMRHQVGRKPRRQILFGDGDAHLALPNSQDGWFAGAVRRCMTADPGFPRITMHDLRHTAASLAISAGANVKAVQRMLGHASAAMTLDTYADLFDDDLEYVADALSRARDATVVQVVESALSGASLLVEAEADPDRQLRR
ncbi:MAG: site-specific integrase [Microbacterium sp.]|jgi:integrase|nr:site-specific integrase [Microbacterium sp.]